MVPDCWDPAVKRVGMKSPDAVFWYWLVDLELMLSAGPEPTLKRRRSCVVASRSWLVMISSVSQTGLSLNNKWVNFNWKSADVVRGVVYLTRK